MKILTGREKLAQDREALQALVESDGWAVLEEAVQPVHGTEAVLQDLVAVAERTTDMATLGALVAARLNAFNAIQGMFKLPDALIEVLQRQEEEYEAQAAGE